MIEALKLQPLIWWGMLAMLGLCVGSFLNVVIYRWPRMWERDWLLEVADSLEAEGYLKQVPDLEAKVAAAREDKISLLRPRSRCPKCGHQITALENIPVLSWLVLGRKCSACKTPISARYPAVELLTAVLTVLCGWHFGVTWAALAAITLTWGLIALAFIDFDTMYLPDAITLPLVWIGLLFNLGGVLVDLPSAVLGAVAGYLSLWSVNALFKLVRGQDGMGGGDFKLLAALGAFMGWKMLPLIVLLSSFVGAVFGVVMIILSRMGREAQMPFGPYLACAGFIALLWGESLTRFYLGLF